MAMAVAQLRDEGPGEDDHGLCQGGGGDTKQEILKPGYEQIMDEIDPVSILGEAVDDWASALRRNAAWKAVISIPSPGCTAFGCLRDCCTSRT